MCKWTLTCASKNSLLELDRWKMSAWTSFQTHWTTSPSAAMKIRILFHLQRSERPGNLASRDTSRRPSSPCPLFSQSALFRWCNDPWHSCWQHPLCQWSVDQSWRAAGRCQFWFHLKSTKANESFFLYIYFKFSTKVVTDTWHSLKNSKVKIPLQSVSCFLDTTRYFQFYVLLTIWTVISHSQISTTLINDISCTFLHLSG